MCNSPHHPQFTHHYGKLIEMAGARGIHVGLDKYADSTVWHVTLENNDERVFHTCMPLGLALEAAIEHLAGVPIC
jgi:hypothetical protein